MYNRFITIGCIPPYKCSFVYNGIVPVTFNENYKYYANEKFNIPRDTLIILSIGRATFYEGLDFIIQCADILINKNKEKNIYFLFCGNGPDLNKFKNMVTDYNLTNKFIFAGKRNDISQILQSCHIGMHASLGEACSLSILEYMSAGLATLVPNNCGNDELIQDNINGFLYPTRNAEYAVCLLEKLIRDENLRKKLVSAGIHSVRERFNLTRTNAEFIKLISDKL